MSNTITGRIVEAGDDEAGQPRLIIYTTQEQLEQITSNIMFKDVRIEVEQEPR